LRYDKRTIQNNQNSPRRRQKTDRTASRSLSIAETERRQKAGRLGQLCVLLHPFRLPIPHCGSKLRQSLHLAGRFRTSIYLCFTNPGCPRRRRSRERFSPYGRPWYS
jgi:hypothetical protein